jgi:iron complex outermembrane receptor protein
VRNLTITVAVGCVALELAAFVPGIALAQENPASSTDVLEEVTVTAQFKSESAQDTPLAITAITAEMLNQRGAVDLAAAAGWVPNVNLARGTEGFGQVSGVFIRGIGQSDPHFALEPGVGVYVDDVYYGVVSGAMFELLDTDRVEVLRGPQGTLAGKNSIGGALKLFSKLPGPEADAYAEVSYGSYDRVMARAASNFTLVPDRLFARFSAATRHRDGYVDRLDYACATGDYSRGTAAIGPDCKLGTQGGESVWTARGSLRWLPTDRVENTTIFDIVQDSSENPAAKTAVQSPAWAAGANYITGPESYTNYETYASRPTATNPTASPFNLPSSTPLDGWGVTNKLTIELSDSMALTSITGFRESTVALSAQLDGTPASILDQTWTLDHQQFTQELRLSGDFGSFADWTVGGFYYDADGESRGRVNIAGGVAPGGGGVNLDTIFRDPVTTRSKSAFAHLILHPLEKLSLTTAVRYTDDLKEFTFNRFDSQGNPHPTLGALLNLTRKFSGSRVDYRVAVDYKWTDSFLTYAQWATGYKGGGINPRPFFASQVVPYEPETLKGTEVGMKGDFLSSRLRVNLAAFQNEYDDFQATLLRCDAFSPFPGAPCTMSTNAGDAEIRGAELETQLRILNGLAIEASVGYLDFEYQSVSPVTGITLDMTNVYTPKLSAAFGMQYAFDLGTLGMFTPRVDYTYRSEVFGAAVNAPINRLPARKLVNVRIGWSDAESKWDASVACTNLLDEFYYESTQLRQNAPYFAGTRRPGWPREVFFTVRRNF